MNTRVNDFTDAQLLEMYRMSRNGVSVGSIMKKFDMSPDSGGYLLCQSALFAAAKLASIGETVARTQQQAERSRNDAELRKAQVAAEHENRQRSIRAKGIARKLADRTPLTDDEREFVLNHIKETTNG